MQQCDQHATAHAIWHSGPHVQVCRLLLQALGWWWSWLEMSLQCMSPYLHGTPASVAICQCAIQSSPRVAAQVQDMMRRLRLSVIHVRGLQCMTRSWVHSGAARTMDIASKTSVRNSSTSVVMASGGRSAREGSESQAVRQNSFFFAWSVACATSPVQKQPKVAVTARH
jgi:hypothetical protein